MAESNPTRTKPPSRKAAEEIAAWLRTEAGDDGAHGSIPALRTAADYIERRLAPREEFDPSAPADPESRAEVNHPGYP